MSAILTVASSLLGTKVGRYAVLVALSALIIGVFILRIYSAGKDAERLRQSEQSLKNLRTRMKLDDEIQTLPADDRLKRLNRWVRD